MRTFSYKISVYDEMVCAKVYEMEEDSIVSRCAIKFFSNPFHSLDTRLNKAHEWTNGIIDTLEKHLVVNIIEVKK